MSVYVVLAIAFAAVLVGGFAIGRFRARRLKAEYAAGNRRILVPFSGTLDRTVLAAAIRIARAEEALLVPAYLLVVPLQYPENSAQKD